MRTEQGTSSDWREGGRLRGQASDARDTSRPTSTDLAVVANPPDHEAARSRGEANQDAGPRVTERRLLQALQRLLMLEATDVETALTQAAQQIAEALGADKVDVFLYEPAAAALVALGTSVTPMGILQRQLGLDRLPIADGGCAVRMYQSGESVLMRNTLHEEGELQAIVEQLGVRSMIGTPVTIHGERRGVLLACSATPARFSEDDLGFLGAVAHWVGLVGYRAALVEQTVAQAVQESLLTAVPETIAKLTPRQREVSELVACGLTNAQIAERLVLTPGTVANHVENILRRLRFRSRAQVAALFGTTPRPS